MSSNVENTLKRAHELVEVGQKVQALNLLFELISNRRQHRRMWTKVHEDAMMLFVRLCVDLKDNRVAREGLHSYRNIAQSQAPASLEAVINFMLDLSDAKVSGAVAQCKSTRDVSRIVGDLDEGNMSPEAMLFATVASEKDRVRSEQAILVPWLKFAWENLRSVLETLRNNPGMEHVYHTTAHRALAFCKQYSRKTEFRRLCELLRQHLEHQLKVKEGQEDQPRLTPESMDLHLGTRFEQLKVLTALHSWNEGTKTIEDIHKIISASPKKPSVQLMATYYQKLTQMFLVSGNYLYHAFAFRMYYDISRERNKALTADQLRTMASSVLLATMSVPLPAIVTLASAGTSSAAQSEQTLQKNKNRRMAPLLAFDQLDPDRDTLLKAVRAGKVLDDCAAEVRDLFNALELQAVFDPQTLVARCAPKIAAVRADPKLEPYAAPIERLLVIRLISQLGKVFQSVRLGDFHGMIDQLGGSLSRLEAEKLIVQAVRSKQVSLRHGSSDIKIDHVSGTIRFTENVLEEQRTRDSLTVLAKHLNTVCKTLKRGPYANAATTAAIHAATTLSNLSGPQLAARVAEEQARILDRKALIMQRRAEMEDLQAYRSRLRDEKDEAERRLRLDREQQRALKIAEDNRKREEEKRARQIQEEEAAKLRAAGIEVNADLELTAEERDRLLREKQEKQMQQALEHEKKLQTRLKRMDALVRATREAEKVVLARESERKRILEREEFEKESERALLLAKERHAEGLVLKAAFARIHPYRTEFERTMNPIWKKNIDDARRAWMDEQHERRRAEKLERALERRNIAQRERRQAEEAAQRAEMEAQRIQQAEEEMRRREEARASAMASGGPSQHMDARDEQPSSEGRYKARTNVEAAMDDNYQGRSAKQQAPPSAAPQAENKPAEGGKAVWKPKFLQGKS